MGRKRGVKYYPQRDLIKEVADRNFLNNDDVYDIFKSLYDIIIDKFSSAENVEIGLFPGLRLTCKQVPIQNFKLRGVVDSHCDYILNVGLRTTQLLKDKIRKRRLAASREHSL